MDIASLVIRARPESLADVQQRLAALPGVEVAAASPQGRLAITIEDVAGTAFRDTLLAVHRLEGVLSATLVYQFSDDSAETLEAMP